MSSVVVAEPRLPTLSDVLFLPDWYGRRYPEAVLEVRQGKFESLRRHYERAGFRAGLRPSPVFIPKTYEEDPLSEYSPASGEDPITHYMNVGAARGASPHWLFDERYYLERNPDVTAALAGKTLISGYHHYLATCLHENRRPHPLFNRTLYAQLNGLAETDAHFLHYVEQGVSRNALTCGLFDPEWYASIAPDVVPHSGMGRTFDNLLHHFVRYGAAEGRAPVPDFDLDYYIRTHDDVRKSLDSGQFRSAVDHWIYCGAERGFNPNRFFNSEYYVQRNPQVRAELSASKLAGAFEHFLLFGRKRGLECNPPLVQIPIDEEQAKVAYARRARTAAMLSRVRRPKERTESSFRPPAVTVVIPVHNNADYTFHLVSDLLSRTYDHPMEIVIVDNASTDETVDIAKYFPEVTYIHSATNEGFPAACNRGLSAARGRFVIFANNDIEVLPGSIDAIVEVLADNDGIGAVGPRIVRMHGRLQEAGGIVHTDASTSGHGRDDDPDAPRYGWRQDVHYCSAVFLGARKDVLEAVGGFDTAFSPGYYEEVDLCARIWKMGKRVVVDPSAVVYHFEHATFSRGRPAAAAQALMHRHRRLFAEKNAAFVSTCLPKLSSTPDAGIGSGVHSASVLLIEDFLPLPFLGSGFPRASRIVRTLTELGYRVVVYALFRHQAGTWLDSKRHLPAVEVHYDDESPQILEELLSTREFSAVWMCRTHNLERISSRLRIIQSLKRKPRLVLDTEALASNRTAALRALNAGEEMFGADKETVSAELAGAEVFDCIVAVNELERRQIAAAFPRVSVVLVGHDSEYVAGQPGHGFDERSGFLFVGSVHAELSPNYEGLGWFCREVWPKIRRQDPRASLRVAGYWDPAVAPAPFLEADGIEFQGAVQDLRAEYERARVFIAPIRYAAGIPLKVQEAMTHGLPCVVTQLLASQIDLENGVDAAVSSALDPSQFAERAVELHRSRELWTRIQARALGRRDRDWSPAQFTGSVLSALDGAAPIGH